MLEKRRMVPFIAVSRTNATSTRSSITRCALADSAAQASRKRSDELIHQLVRVEFLGDFVERAMPSGWRIFASTSIADSGRDRVDGLAVWFPARGLERFDAYLAEVLVQVRRKECLFVQEDHLVHRADRDAGTFGDPLGAFVEHDDRHNLVSKT